MGNMQQNRLRAGPPPHGGPRQPNPYPNPQGQPQPRPPQRPGGAQEELTPDAIARHIAPEPHRPQPQGPQGLPPRPAGRPPKAGQARFSFNPKTWSRKQLLFIGGGGLAVLCLLLVATVAIFSMGGSPESSEPAALAQNAGSGETSGAQMQPVADTPPAQPEPSVTPVLTTAPMLQVEPGATIPFAMFLQGGESLPPGSSIAITGIPPGTQFSAGRSVGGGEWRLRPDEIQGVAIVVPPETADGSHNLSLDVVTAEGDMLAKARTELIVHNPEGSAPASAEADTAAEPEPAEEPVVEEAANAPEPAAVAPPTPAAASGDGKWMVVTTAVNMRAEPESGSSTVTVMPKGKRLQVSDEKFGWLQATDPESGQSGWIYKTFLNAE